jgi:tetratricopeptide (TPR) repeat protein
MTERPSFDELEPDPPGPSGELTKLRPFGDELDDVEGQELLARLESSLFRRPAEPRTLGRWLILERRGAGAMGVVYAAYDPRLDRRVALKVLRAGRNDRTDARARMLREAQALAKISDPHVVHIYDVEELEGNVCLVMELIGGTTLEAWQRKPQPLRELLDRYVAVAHGLAKIHDAGLVHRDVKPSNVLVDGSRVVIADFGLVLAEDDAQLGDRPTGSLPGRSALELSLTEDGAIVGTLGYMAPEQLAGEGASPRSDQFAFFVSLYEAITGVRPFRGTTPRAVVEAMTVAPLARAPNGVPLRRWLYRILQRGLAADPEQRFTSMGEVEAALVRGRDRGRRARTLVLMLAGLGLAALGYGLGGRGEALEDPVAQCRARVADLPAIWNDRLAARLEQARARGRDVEVAAWEQLARAFEVGDERRRAWWLEACGRAASPDPSPAALLRDAEAQGCLGAYEIDLRASADALIEADTLPELQEVEQVHARLIAPRDCPVAHDEHAKGREAGEPAEMVDRLSRARAQEDLGEHREVERLTAALADQAQGSSLTRLEGEARYLRGRALLVLGLPQKARDSFEVALDAAAAVGDRSLGARSAVMLAKVVGNDLQDANGGRGWLKLAGYELRAIGELDRRGPLYTDYLEAQGLVAFTGRQYAAAEAQHRAALERRRELGNAVPAIEALESMGNLANALSRLDRKAEALALLQASVAAAEARYGPQHPYCADAWINIGKVHEAEARLDLAADAYRRAVAIDLARRDRGGLPALRGLTALGVVAQLKADDAALIDAAAHVEAIHEQIAVEDPEAMTHVDRADELRLVAAGRHAKGDVEGAVLALRAAAAILEGRDPVGQAESLADAEALLQDLAR